ncbi:hypothetical protein WA026_004562 [Henosepilachna vigintioctopunctata]|uniref:Uncharacterized protein n=1 Tax=Henosepilachna vigintioctopunctata TaxID=420089 RepID=A0AAW1V2H6_9CUCU
MKMRLFHLFKKIAVNELPISTLFLTDMVSRRRILSRSRDDLHMDSTFQPPEDEDDVWYQKDKLYKVGASHHAYS